MSEEGERPMDAAQGAGAADDEQLRQQIEEQLKKLRVEDVLLQTVVTLVNLAGRRLTVPEERDLEQARTGIDAVRALLPLCPQDQVSPVRDALSQLQMIYTQEVQQPAAPSPPAEPGAQPSESEAEPAPKQSQEEAERAKARSKIWTPPGT
jgi:hypothetical protein